MADDEPSATHNTSIGRTGQTVQARDIHGGVHFHGVRRRTWVAGVCVIAAVGAAAALVVAWPRSSTAASTGSGSAALAVTVDLSFNDQHPWGYASDSPNFLSAALVAQLAKPNAAINSSIPHGIRQSGAAELRTQTISMDIQGPRDQGVRITDIRPVILSRQAPLNGGMVWAKPQGPEESVEAQLYLDDPFPVLQDSRPYQDDRIRTGNFFPGQSIHLNPSETSQVVLTVIASSHSYVYELDLTYLDNGQSHSQIVTNNGQPFRITGFACTAPAVASYRRAYLLQGDFSLTAAPVPGHLVHETDC